MRTITFECETITPMFLSGADGSTPELRPPSIKGALRFWWRAMNGHLPLGELKKREGEIFGDTTKRSTFSERVVLQNHVTARNAPVPHKGYTLDCYGVGTKFQVTFIMPVHSPVWSIEKCASLFEIISILGGLGKRVRRGMGAFRILNASGDYAWKKPEAVGLAYIHELLKQFSPHYSLHNGKISNQFPGTMSPFPWLKEVQLGQEGGKSDTLLRHISQTTHDLKKADKNTYEASLGHASGGRFASPVYVSVIQQGTSPKPVVSTLATYSNRNTHDISLDLQRRFRDDILE